VGRILLAIVATITLASCGDVNAALKELTDARALAADLQTQFVKAANAADRAVMADTDAVSVAAAAEARQAKEAVQHDVDALGPALQRLRYENETALLQSFSKQYAAYDALDRQILDLAVESTNLKAQRLSFGPAQDAADSFRDALDGLVPADAAREWRMKALAATAVARLREIQILQAPHIADADDAVMTRMEQRMATSDAAVRTSLEALGSLVAPASRARLATAATALDRFKAVNDELLALSRRNTNVRSLALSLNQKRPLVTACDATLKTLQAALARHGYPEGR
jgi:hypothetical protein